MSSLIDNLRDTQEREANLDRAKTKHFLAMLCMALVAIREAGMAGNQRCKAAMQELEQFDHEYRRTNPTH